MARSLKQWLPEPDERLRGSRSSPDKDQRRAAQRKTPDSAQGRPRARGAAAIRHAWGDLAEAQEVGKDGGNGP